MSGNIIPFDRKPSGCDRCIGGEICGQFPENGTDAEKDAWYDSLNSLRWQVGGFPCDFEEGGIQ